MTTDLTEKKHDASTPTERKHWLDAVIDGALLGNSPETIARTIANSDKFLAAVRRGLHEANQVTPGTIGPSSAQYVRRAVCEAISDN